MLLRHSFDSEAQLQRHLHAASAGTLLFFADPGLTVAAGAGVQLAIDLRSSRQQINLRGTLHSRVRGPPPGAWLQFPGLRLMRKLESEPADMTRRKSRRVSGDLLLQVREPDASARIVRLLDVSKSGARLGAASGLHEGTLVELQLLTKLEGVAQALGAALVVRANADDVGVQFAPAAGERVGKLMDALEMQWKSARAITHISSCCRSGVVIEPTLPHAGSSRMRG